MDCIFCKIVQKEVPSTIVYENDHFVAFPDLSPVAPVHILIIPKKHIESISTMTEDDESKYMGSFFNAVQEVSKIKGLSSNGFRLVVNTGADGGQTVMHFHAHVIGGKTLGWPPFKD